MDSIPPLDNTFLGLWQKIMPAPSSPGKSGYPSLFYVEEAIRLASCLEGGSFIDKLNTAIAILSTTPISLLQTLTAAPETFTFEVINGRLGSISTNTIGVINAATTYSVQYQLVASGAWVQYTGGLFTGVEINQAWTFVGIQNRIVYTPNAALDTNIMIAL